MWRIVDDVWDVWKDLVHLIEVAQGWYVYTVQAPGQIVI